MKFRDFCKRGDTVITFRIAREKISKGDVVVKLWKNWCRRAKASDTALLGCARHNALKGIELEIIKLT